MDEDNIVLKLQLITLFDSICFGLIYAFINPYLLMMGADHLTIGIYSVLYLVCQLISKDITAILTYNIHKYKCLFHVSAVAFISHLLITMSTSYWYIIFARCLFGLTNQTNSMIKDLLLQRGPKEQTKQYISLHTVVSSVGYIVGPVISGCLFSLSFHLCCYMAATLTLINIWLILSMSEEDMEVAEPVEQPLIEKSVEKFQQLDKDLRDSNFRQNWDVMALKYLFSASVSIFFTKFTQILKHNFDSNAVVIGYTTSYMNGLTFGASFFLQSCKIRRESDSVLFVKVAFITLVLSVLIACYSPTHHIYSLVCIPMSLSRNYINTIWKDLFTVRNNPALSRLNESVGIAAGLTIPILFGIMCNYISHHAVILFSVLPLIACLYIYERYTIPFYNKKQEQREEDEVDKNKDD